MLFGDVNEDDVDFVLKSDISEFGYFYYLIIEENDDNQKKEKEKENLNNSSEGDCKIF